MRSCERPLKRSAREAVASSVSKRYSLSIRTQGNSCRCRASSSLRRVSSFSAASSSRRAASHSSRVPVLWLVIGCFLGLFLNASRKHHGSRSRGPSVNSGAGASVGYHRLLLLVEATCLGLTIFYHLVECQPWSA